MWVSVFNILEGLCWILLGCFSLHQVWMLGTWAKYRHRRSQPERLFEPLPFVTVQLPVFNEPYVVERLLDAVAQMDYPRDRLEIQVLDDSMDETTALAGARVARLQALGHQVSHLRRSHRHGFKAGALAEGLTVARGEFLAVFDADFVPPSDFLRKTVHYFTDATVGMVQVRWGHLNADDSLLTRAQMLMLDGHFLIEQVARSRGGYFFNFNGSAGIWRREAVIESGGWQADTLTEDFDLSYRAQLNGWRFVYLDDVVVPAELPSQMSSLKTQQHRWTKGSIQTAFKLLPMVWRSARPWHVKIAASFHFGNWLHYPIGLLVSVLLLPALILSRSALADEHGMTWGGWIGCLLLATTVLFYAMAHRRGRNPWRRLWLDLPGLMVVSAGLAINNTRAIWEALRGTPFSFERTPKYSTCANGLARLECPSLPRRATWWWTEVALGLYVCVALGYAASQALYAAVPFLVPLSAGFLYAGFSSLAPSLPLRAKAEAPPVPLAEFKPVA